MFTFSIQPNIRIRLIFILCCLSITVNCAHSQQSSKPKIFYSGVSYLGNFNTINTDYPFALALNVQSLKTNRLDTLFLQHLQAKPLTHFTLSTGLANLRQSESIVVSLAIEKERVSEEIIGTKRKLIFDVGAQLLFMDFKSQALIANYPLEMALNHVESVSSPVDGSYSDMFSRLYLGTEKSDGLIQMAANIARTIDPFNAQKLRFQVSQVELTEKARSFLPDEIDLTSLEQYLGQYFTARLAKETNVLVLPYIKGYAIGNQMAGRFANGDVYTLTLPEPDYVFDLDILDFQKVTKNHHLIYAARMGFSFIHTESERSYIEGKFHFAVPKLVSKNSAKVDDWSAWEDSVESLMSELIAQLENPESVWHKKHSSNKTSFKQFKQKQELFREN